MIPALALAVCVLLLVAGLGLVRSDATVTQRVGGHSTRAAWSELMRPQAVREALARRAAPHALKLLTGKRRAEILHRIDVAGRPRGLTLNDYAGQKAVSVLAFGAVGALVAALVHSPLFVPALGCLGWLRIDLALLAQGKRRQARIDRDLPDFLDVLAVTVNAGLGFRAALARVAAALGGPVGDEIRIALQQMSYGVSRRAAFEGIRERNDSESLAKLMSALLQAEDLGAPLSETLAAIAVDMRRSFAQRARREAARAVPRVSLVTSVVMLPGFLILVVGALYTASGSQLGRIFG